MQTHAEIIPVRCPLWATTTDPEDATVITYLVVGFESGTGLPYAVPIMPSDLSNGVRGGAHVLRGDPALRYRMV
jgi:hypothetical protein